VVLALTIQAFGQITNADVKARLKQSDDLLAMLSQQAQSGSSDLIRWSAATVIENVGFDFIAVSQHLTEEPRSIAEKIVQSKIKRFVDRDLLESEGYQEFLNFWIYGDRYKLREVTLDYDFGKLHTKWQYQKQRGWHDSKDRQEIERLNKFSVCWQVMNALDLRGLKEVNATLQLAESMGDIALDIDENQIFEGIAQIISSEMMEKPVSNENLQILIDTQTYCLQSNNIMTRQAATTTLTNMGLDRDILDNIKNNRPILKTAIFTLNSKKTVNLNTKSYTFLKLLADDFEYLYLQLSRKEVKKDCQSFLNHVLMNIQELPARFKERQASSQQLLLEIEGRLTQIKKNNPEVFAEMSALVKFDKLPQTNFQDDFIKSFNDYDQSLKNKLSQLRETVNRFYKDKTDNHKLNELNEYQNKSQYIKSEYLINTKRILLLKTTEDKYEKLILDLSLNSNHQGSAIINRIIRVSISGTIVLFFASPLIIEAPIFGITMFIYLLLSQFGINTSVDNLLSWAKNPYTAHYFQHIGGLENFHYVRPNNSYWWIQENLISFLISLFFAIITSLGDIKKNRDHLSLAREQKYNYRQKLAELKEEKQRLENKQRKLQEQEATLNIQVTAMQKDIQKMQKDIQNKECVLNLLSI